MSDDADNNERTQRKGVPHPSPKGRVRKNTAAAFKGQRDIIKLFGTMEYDREYDYKQNRMRDKIELDPE